MTHERAERPADRLPARLRAVKARPQVGNQLRDLVITVPEPLRAQLSRLGTPQRVRAVGAFTYAALCGVSTVGTPSRRSRVTKPVNPPGPAGDRSAINSLS